MNKISLFLFILLIVPLFVHNVEALDVERPLIYRGPYEGAKDSFYSDDINIDYALFSQGEVSVIKGPGYVNFDGSSIIMNWRGFLASISPSPIVILSVNFKPKLVAGDRFIKVNLTLELDYLLPFQSYFKINYPDGSNTEIRGEGKQKIVKDITNIAPDGSATITLELYVLGILGQFFNSYVKVKIYETLQRTFKLATKHEMYFSEDYKTVYHYASIPIQYSTGLYDETYVRILYPKVFELINASRANFPYSFDGWSKKIEGNATVLMKKAPFGEGNIETVISMTFKHQQSIYLIQTLTSLLSPSESWTYNETMRLVAINLDIKIKELRRDQFNFGYYIINPDGDIIGYYDFPSESFRVEETRESPLGRVLVANANITLDFTYNRPGMYRIQTISITPYSLGINETRFLVYDIDISKQRLTSISTVEIAGSFNITASLNISEYGIFYQGAFLIAADESSPSKPYSKTFKVTSGIGVSSLVIKNKIEYPGTLDKPSEPNLAFFTLINNSTETKILDEIIIGIEVFDQLSIATFSLLGKEPNYLKPGEIRSYALLFSIALLNQYLANYLAKNYNITAKIISQQTGKSYGLNFTYGKDPSKVNPAVIQLERTKVWKLIVSVDNKVYSSDFLLYDPGKYFKGDLLFVAPALLEGSIVTFNSSLNLRSAIQKYAIYGITYTSDYLVKIKEILRDSIKVELSLEGNYTIKGKAGEPFTISVLAKNLSNVTSVTFNIKVYSGFNTFYENTYLLQPNENKVINISLTMPEGLTGDYLIVESSTLGVIVAILKLEYSQDILENITKPIGPVVSNQTIILIIIIILTVLILLRLFLKKL